MARRRQKCWSYKTGERGRNRVRAYEDGRDGRLYLEWREQVEDEAGDLVTKKKRALLDTTDRGAAKKRADTLAAEFASIEQEGRSPLSIARLLTLYTKERTPEKGVSKQEHDRRARRIWVTFLDTQPEPERRSSRHPSTFDRIDWDRFIEQRRDGRIPGWGPVRARQIAYDLKYLVAVLNWALGASGQDGKPYLARNPWSGDIRRSQSWPMPKEARPRRPQMTDTLREQLSAHGPWQFGLALWLGRLTVSRNSSVRRLRWSDLDLDRETVRWPGQFDKNGQEVEVPLPSEAVRLLRAAPVRGIGDAWVFASATDPSRPAPRHTFQTWLRRAKKALLKSIEDEGQREQMRRRLVGLGFHGEKRAGVRDPRFRRLSDKAQEAISRTRYQTLRDVYDDMDVDDLRREIDQAREA